jgi:eukaryotic-like serine/threonine-protein kinase
MAERFGRYELIHPLGKGGMSEVYLARLGSGLAAKHLAIKRLLPGFGQSPRLVQRLVDEARLCIWLSHPNIVSVFDFGKVGEAYFIALEYVDGCDLQLLLNPPGKPTLQLPMEVALEIAFRVLDGLRHAHSCTDGQGRPLGIIHRDVSPQNILISRDGIPKLGDFGVARATLEARDRTVPGVVLGKLSYMPPEQALGLPCDRRVDLYAVGATLYQMLTGSRPFDDRSGQPPTRWDLVPAPPSSLRSSMPRSLDELILRALAPRPEERFASAEQMGAAVLQELAAAGGPPKPHQLRQLVADAIHTRRTARRWLRSSSAVTPDDFTTGEESLIPGEVTQVRQLHSIYEDLPELEEIPEEPPTPAEPLVVVSSVAVRPDSTAPTLAPASAAAARPDSTARSLAPPLERVPSELTETSAVGDTSPWVTPVEPRWTDRLLAVMDRLRRLDLASRAILVAAGLAVLLLGLCVGRLSR